MDIERWRRIISAMDYAFQPVVSIHTGSCLGYEALLRNTDKEGFRDIKEVFDTAYADGVLFKVELLLREKAIKKFVTIENHTKMRLFSI